MRRQRWPIRGTTRFVEGAPMMSRPPRRHRNRPCPAGVGAVRVLGAAVLCLLLASVSAPGVSAQPAAPATEAVSERGDGVAPAEIPARADADEKFIQAAQRRAQATDRVLRLEQSLSRQAAAIDRLAELTDGTDLSALSVKRLESLERHWLLHERTLAQTRAELLRLTPAIAASATIG
jgi:hypothetical protein